MRAITLIRQIECLEWNNGKPRSEADGFESRHCYQTLADQIHLKLK